MAWIGIRQAGDRWLADLPAPGSLHRGTLLVDLRHDPADAPRNLLRLALRDPEPAALILRLDPDGTLNLLTRQGDRAAEAARLATGLTRAGEAARITYSWEAQPGHGTLSVASGLSGRTMAVDLPRIVAPATETALRIVTDDAACRIAPLVNWIAIADHVLPAGPLPGLGPQTPVATASGAVPIHRLRAGDNVLTRDGPAQVAWCGAVNLPACGVFAPVLMRAPYYGLREDILLTAGQRLYLSGHEVDYLFGTESVALAAGDLVDGRACIAVTDPRGLDWWQVVLDRPGPIDAAGLMLQPLIPEDLPATAPLGDRFIAAGLVPAQPAGCPMLAPAEAQALRKLRAA